MQRSTRTRPRIGLFLRASAYAYQTEILAGAHEECERRDFDLYCFAGGNLSGDEAANFMYELAGAEHLDGAILVPGTMGVRHDHPRALALLDRVRDIPLCTIGVRYASVSSVCVDNSIGIELVTSHLIRCHEKRRIAFLGGHGPEAEERLLGYERGLRAEARQLDSSLIVAGDFSENAGRAAVDQLLDRGRLRCDALIAANDWMALGALDELQRRGFRVPEDVAVVGFDDVEAASFVRPALTTIRQPTRELGLSAVAQLAAQLAGARESKSVVLPTVLRVRESCGCLFDHEHVLISERQAQAEGQRRVRNEALTRQLNDMASESRAAPSFEALEAVLARHLPLLQIPGCYVVAGQASRAAELVVAYRASDPASSAATARKLAERELLPAALTPNQRHSLVVHALSHKNGAFSYCALELGPANAALYKALSELIAAALDEARARKELVEEATQRALMAREIELLARIHAAILPRSTSVEGLEIVTSLLPAAGVGGDYFDILPCSRGCWLGIGDVAGHGLQSGLVMLMIQSIVSALVRHDPHASAAALWSSLNAVLRENIRERLMQDEHVTLTLIRYTLDGRLQFAGAHEELVVYRKRMGHCERIATPGIWAGIRDLFRNEVVIESECVLEPGDVLVLYTDGLIDALSSSGEAFGIDRLCAAIETAASEPVRAIRRRILDDLKQFMHEQSDDIGLVVARYH